MLYAQIVDKDLRDRWLTHANGRVADSSLRAGAGRASVIELLGTEAQCLLSAQEIIDLLRARGGGSSATVYRSLDELWDLGLVHRLSGHDGVARYEIADPELDHHHHIIDDETGKLIAFSDEALESAIEAVANRLGFRLTGHDVLLRGSQGADEKS